MNSILIITAPRIPGYFNAVYNTSIFQVAEFLRNRGCQVTCEDISALNYTWKDISDLLRKEKYKLICIMNDYDAVDNFPRLMRYIEELAPNAKVMTFGRLSMQIPKFFFEKGIDYIAYQGDYEKNVISVLDHMNKTGIPEGCYYYVDGVYEQGRNSTPLAAEFFEFPNVTEVPYESYYRLYEKESNKFCGIPNRKELIVHASRGCPIGCDFCDVQKLQGRLDRRVSPTKIVDYILKSFKKQEFDYVTFFSAIFTLNKKWCNELYTLLMKSEKYIPWKCVTTIKDLNVDDISLMKKAGCFRIGLGIETMEEDAKSLLPKEKKNFNKKLDEIFKECQNVGIEVNAFIMFGFENETIEGIKRTISYIESNGGRIRPALFAPYEKLSDKMTYDQVSQFNRQIFTDFQEFNFEHKQQIYDYIYKYKYDYKESKVGKYIEKS
jgi:anaerobic magnesium-protoporphyrin IX monomethyl ester cyclase